MAFHRVSKMNTKVLLSSKYLQGSWFHLVVETSDSLEAEYFIQPSHLSNMKAVQLHFPDKEDAQKLINSTKFNEQTRPNNRKVKNVFDPILTEEVLQQLLGGEKTTLHNHDLISQAKAEELIDIINDSKYNDPTAIYYTKLDSDLAKFLKQMYGDCNKVLLPLPMHFIKTPVYL